MKDPHSTAVAPSGVNNLELISVAPSAPEAWGTTAEEFASGVARTNARYRTAREAFGDRLIQIAERVLPALEGDIVYRELSTPLTHWRYTGATGGTPYGIAPIPSQMLGRRPGTKTEVDNLYLCGASTRLGGGLLPVMLSGVLAAEQALGHDVIARSTQVGPAFRL